MLRPMWVLVGSLAVTDVLLTIQLLRSTKVIRSLSAELETNTQHALAAVVFANALADRGINIECDDCGNPMGPSDLISVIPKPDGSIYVGHRSHNRAGDWGYRV